MADFGTDLEVDPDLAPTVNEISGPDLVVQSIFCRYQTAPGTLFYDPSYGYDVSLALNDYTDRSALARHRAGLQKQALLEEGVKSASVSSTVFDGGVRFTVRGVAAAGPFDFAVSVSEVGVVLEKERAR